MPARTATALRGAHYLRHSPGIPTGTSTRFRAVRRGKEDPMSEQPRSEQPAEDVVEDVLVEDVSIDGMCGVY